MDFDFDVAEIAHRNEGSVLSSLGATRGCFNEKGIVGHCRAQHGVHWEFLLRSRSGREVSDDSAVESAQVSPVEIEEVERRATLFRLVDKLPAEQRKVVVLRFVEQKSIKEVAREIRKTEGAVKQLQFRALTSLRARMEGANA